MDQKDGSKRPLEAVGSAICNILTSFESVQENILFQQIGAAQEQLKAGVETSLETMNDLVAKLDPESLGPEFIDTLLRALKHLVDGYETFLRRDQDFSLSFLSMRRDFCRAADLLYSLKNKVPRLNRYWLLDKREEPTPLSNTAQNENPTGLITIEANSERAAYALYVPESYSEKEKWPLVVSLHGGYGRETEYIWTWLRAARSSSHIILAPKSLGVTWSILEPEKDSRSISQMIEEVSQNYAIDRSKILLTGLSDGGTFTYLFGLSQPEKFTALAPIAAAFHPMMDNLLREGKGKDTPLMIVHGKHDNIFPVSTARSANELFSHLDYAVTYKELPEWGHAYTYKINENIVLPWFLHVCR